MILANYMLIGRRFSRITGSTLRSDRQDVQDKAKSFYPKRIIKRVLKSVQISVNPRLIKNKNRSHHYKKTTDKGYRNKRGIHMKHIAQKITREAAKDPVNPANPRPNKTKARASGR